MKFYFTILLFIALTSFQVYAKSEEGDAFSDGEANFKSVMQKLLDKYVDKSSDKKI